ncbi:MBL fold metallo-hydrolase [Lentimicrobium sp. S6]|uniref:MBL fold metallo-hydrolase n=1 Tax=Lentimicrobium sp. S6 TaxID=2735872 RepID=UPI001552BE19|nr:MBL fold metallo-hydrolase [Lentimicrobium sp. S6]NPD44204.1 MBL fold metallo-hydrolase [Lentimicrobium sp. S6]
MIQIKILPFNPFQCNCYVLWVETKEAIIVDPSFSSEQEYQVIAKLLQSEGLSLKGVYNTHCHFDHCFGAPFLKEHHQMDYAAHKDGIQFTENATKQAAVYGMQIAEILPPQIFIDEGESIKFGNSELEILNTPGHADGSLCFVSHSDKFVITGDVLFRESIGRTDLPTGDLDVLLASINNKLFQLPGDFVVYPGHGPQSSIAHEQANNPFLHFGEVH